MQQSDRPADSTPTNTNSNLWTPAELVEFSQSTSHELARETNLPIEWIRSLLTRNTVERINLNDNSAERITERK